MKPFQYSLLCLCCMLLLAGCSIRFVYNQLDWLVPWYVDDYIDFQTEQEQFFERQLRLYLAWHRTDQLPLYAAFLNQAATRMASGLTADDLAWIQTQTEDFGAVLVDKLLPEMIVLIADLDDEQVERMFAQIAQDNKDFRAEYIDNSGQQQRDKRYREAKKYVSRWTGRLNSRQKQLLRQWADDYVLMGTELAQARMRWQQEFRRIIDLRKRAPQRYEQALRQLVATPGFGQSKLLKEQLEINGQLLIDTYVQLDQTLTASQRQHAVEKLRAYAQDFIELSNKDEAM